MIDNYIEVHKIADGSLLDHKCVDGWNFFCHFKNHNLILRNLKNPMAWSSKYLNCLKKAALFLQM